MLLDRNGELLSALRLVVNRMARRTWPDAGRIQIACDGCGPTGRDDEIVQLAREVAQRVARTGRTQRLHPLNAYERRLVHLTVREFGGLSSTSDGNGSLKRVKISKVRSNTLRH
jgi:spoIIIJ-associated protein